MIDRDTLSLALAGVSAFAGAIIGVTFFASRMTWWLSGEFGKLHKRIDVHEKEDLKRFGELQLGIQDAKFQAMANAGNLRHIPETD